ncbi:hypothetical protein PSTG_02231 [Puccinia striiformis f. sp. tritici PST-78]|uniref:Uncharacterized protein n=1 Tax=Puccinia striiformis f. sp. tritici PST-78 TaxID=1165861 RepID=A0A0L0VZP2_9BASI|nr:hypothetical protein PSTG_02231 [Puccinia striiformis f. sp. tritici PST-78]
MSVRPIAFIDHHSSISADSKFNFFTVQHRHSSQTGHLEGDDHEEEQEDLVDDHDCLKSPGPADPDNHILTQVGAFYLGENVNHFRPRSLVPKPIQSSLIAHNHTVFVTSTGAISPEGVEQEGIPSFTLTFVTSQGHSHNMKGVFLPVMADTLGSLPSLTLLIFASVVPLVQDLAKNLMLALDDEKERQVQKALGKLSTIEGLSSYTAARFRPQDLSTITGSIHAQPSPIPSQGMNMSGIASPVMMLPEDDHDHDHEHSSRGYNHADFVKHKLEEILTTDHIPGLTKLLIQIKPFHGSKHCFCLAGPNT